MTEVRFVGPEYDGAEAELGGLKAKLINVANNAALLRFGKQYIKDPTDIEILPTAGADLDESTFIVNAWHETAAPAGMTGILQRHDTSFTVTLEGEDAFIHTEHEQSHPLTSREMLLLLELGGTAIIRSLLARLSIED